jgi:hypothetical protein
MASQEDLQIARDLYSELRGITAELKGQETEISKSRKAFRAFEDVAQRFKLNQEDVSKLNDKELKDLSKKLNTQLAIAKQEGERLKTSTAVGRQLAEEVAELRDLGVEQSAINDFVAQSLKMTGELTDEQKALVAASFDQYKVVEDINGELEKELAIREEANRLMGVAGGLLSTLNAFGGQFAKSLNLDQVEADMAAVADEIARGERQAGLLGGRMSVLAAGAKSAFGGLTETLTDPTVVLGAIAKSYTEYSKSAKEIRQETGISSVTLAEMTTKAGTFNSSLVSSIDAAKTIANLTQETGINVAAAFSPETIGAATDLATLTGLSADATANMALRAEVFGDSLGDARGQAIEVTQEFAQSGKGAFTFKSVLSDAGKASNSLALSIKGGQKGLVEAAAGAAALGINLKKAEGIADQLLDFESSIAAEMEAELLTGQSLNLEKARTAALNNDIATLTEEIGSNQAIMDAFSSGNRIQQDAIAKSLGMQKEDVAKMILTQQKAKGLTDAQAAAAAGISEEEAVRLSTQEQITKSVEKMTAALAPAIGFLASLLENSVVLYTTMGLVGTIMAVKVAGSLADSVKSMTSLASGAGKFFEAASSGEGVGGAVKGALGIGGDAAAQAAEGVGSAADAAGGVGAAPGLGDKIKDFLTGLGDGLKSMAGTKVLQGALNLIPAALGFVAMTAGAIGLAAVALAGTAAGAGLQGLSTGLTVFAQAMAAPTPLGPVGLVAPVALALLGAAMIPFAYALSIAAPAIEAIGTVIHAVFTGVGVIITSVAEGFVMLMDAITLEKALMLPIMGFGLISLAAGVVALGSAAILALSAAATLTLLGLSMIPLSMGFERMAEADTVGLVQSLVIFAGIAPAMGVLAASLFGVAGGLGAIALAGIAAFPIVTALAGLGTVATGISSIFGGGEEEEAEAGGTSTAAMEAKLDELNQNMSTLIATVREGGVVNIDGNKAGTFFAMGASKLA